MDTTTKCVYDDIRAMLCNGDGSEQKLDFTKTPYVINIMVLKNGDQEVGTITPKTWEIMFKKYYGKNWYPVWAAEKLATMSFNARIMDQKKIQEYVFNYVQHMLDEIVYFTMTRLKTPKEIELVNKCELNEDEKQEFEMECDVRDILKAINAALSDPNNDDFITQFNKLNDMQAKENDPIKQNEILSQILDLSQNHAKKQNNVVLEEQIKNYIKFVRPIMDANPQPTKMEYGLKIIFAKIINEGWTIFQEMLKFRAQYQLFREGYLQQLDKLYGDVTDLSSDIKLLTEHISKMEEIVKLDVTRISISPEMLNSFEQLATKLKNGEETKTRRVVKIMELED